MQELTSWLTTPISGAAAHALELPLAWHGRLMVLAWAIGVPVAILLARFYKVTPTQRWPDMKYHPQSAEVMAHPRSACGASPSRGLHLQPGQAKSAVAHAWVLALACLTASPRR